MIGDEKSRAIMAGLEKEAEEAEKILTRLKTLDSQHWSQPSDSVALQIHDLEREYEDLTGAACPAWPRRDPGEMPKGAM